MKDAELRARVASIEARLALANEAEASANVRIAELESQIRRRETAENDLYRKRAATHEARVSELEAELRLVRAGRATALETADTALARLQAYTPVVTAARDVIKAWHSRDDKEAADLGPAACVALHRAVDELPPEPS